MLVTESGMVTDCKDEQYSNALSPMLVTESGIVMDCKDEQYENAWSPMLVTESGMIIFFSLINTKSVFAYQKYTGYPQI